MTTNENPNDLIISLDPPSSGKYLSTTKEFYKIVARSPDGQGIQTLKGHLQLIYDTTDGCALKAGSVPSISTENNFGWEASSSPVTSDFEVYATCGKFKNPAKCDYVDEEIIIKSIDLNPLTPASGTSYTVGATNG